jgi:hypothetical protein
MHAVLDSWNPEVEMALYAASTSYGPAGARFFGVGVDNVFKASVGKLRLKIRYRTHVSYQVSPNQWCYPAEVAAVVGAMRADFLHHPTWFGRNPRIRLIESKDDEQLWEVCVLPEEKPQELFEQLTKKVRRAATSHGASEVEVKLIEAVPPANSPGNHSLVRALLVGAQAATGRTPHVGSISAYTGMSPIQAKLNIPIAAFGYGRIDLCHTPNEWVSVQQVLWTAKAYAVTLSELGQSRGD